MAGPGASLQWEAPPQCPSAVELQAMVDTTLGSAPAEDRRPVAVDGRLRGSATEGFQLDLRLSWADGSGERQLRGPSCHELSEAAALVIAMAIDPRLHERLPTAQPLEPTPAVPDSPPVEPDSDVPAPADPVPATPADSPPKPDPPADLPVASPELRPPGTRSPAADAATTDDRPAVVLHASAGVGAGVVPGVSASLALGIGIAGRGWRVEAFGTYSPPRTFRSRQNPQVGVTAQLGTAGVLGCAEPSLARFSFPLCGGLEAGALRGRGVGEVSAIARAPWLAVVVEAGAIWWLRPRIGLGLRARGAAPILRPALRSDPSGTITRARPVAGALRLGIDARF